MCDKTVDFYLITSKFVPDWFVTNKMLEKLVNSIFSNDDISFHDVDSNIIAFPVTSRYFGWFSNFITSVLEKQHFLKYL